MRVIEILLNAFSVDRHSFYIIFNEKKTDDSADEEGYEEDDPDQLGLDLDGEGGAND